MERLGFLDEDGFLIFKDEPATKISLGNENKSNKRDRSPDTDITQPSKKGMFDTYKLECKFSECSFQTKDYRNLLQHIDEHCSFDDEISDWNCLWDECEFSSSDYMIYKKHVKYHAYELKLVTYASNLAKENDLPICKKPPITELQNLPDIFICEWVFCDEGFNEYQDFLDHIRCHVNGTPKTAKPNEYIKCEWAGCSGAFPRQFRLYEHMRVHTKEKIIACATCKMTFCAKIKFLDHCRKQSPIDVCTFRCSQCYKLFATEKILQIHMRAHVNHYKCHFCDMTCKTPSILAQHIRYRHLAERPFKCDICSHRTVTKHDLKMHRETHNYECKYQCECGFKCRAKYSFNQHIKTVHNHDRSYKYQCHCCNVLFQRGSLLTKHLIKVHDFHWPSGHSRFMYRQNSTSGNFVLTVMRYESLDVTEEIIKGSSVPLTGTRHINFTCEQSKANPQCYTLKLCQSSEMELEIT